MRGNDKLFSIELAFILLGHIETSKYCTKEIGLDLEWDKLLKIDLLIVVYFALWVLPVLRTLDKGNTLDYSSNKNFNNLFNNPVNRNLLGSDKSRLTSKVDCLPSDALSNGKTYRHTSGYTGSSLGSHEVLKPK